MSLNFLPANWDSVPLEASGKWLSGGTPSRSVADYWGGTIPWLGTKDMKCFTLVDAEEHLTKAGVSNGTRLLEPGSVVFAVRGMSLAKEFRVGVTSRRMAFNQDLKAIVPKQGLQGRFLAYYLRYIGPRILQRVETASHGTKRLPLDRIKKIPVPLPPLAEQRRIAEILDKADAIRRKRNEAIALTDELLRSTFLEMFGDPVTNPKGWPVKKLGDLAEFVGGGTPARARPDYYEGSTCWATAKDIVGDVLSDTQEHITPEAIQNSATKLVEQGVLLVVVKSKILARRLPVTRTTVPACFGQDLKAIRLREPATVRYIQRHLQAGQVLLLERARGANTEGLTLKHLNGYPILDPPRDLVERFVSFETATERCRSDLVAAHHQADNLFNSLVQRAFRGEL